MNNYVLSCCSTVDLAKEYLEKRNLKYICFHYELDAKEYKDDLGESTSFDDFYKAMQNGAETKTSQINAAEYEEYFEQFLKEGKDVLHVSLSSGISGSFNSANIAKEMLKEKYPERKIFIVDSLTASSGFGLLVDALADLRDEGKPIDEVYEWAEKNKGKCLAWFFTSDLTFFIKGGRVSKTSGFVAGVLNICPMLNVDPNGKLIARQKVRTKKKVMEAIVKKMEEKAEGGIDYSGKCYMSHSACYEDARAVADMIESKFTKLNGKVEINDIGTTIGSHTGPGTVAVFYWGTDKEA